MGVQGFIAERVQTTASVNAIYGEPVSAEGKTIIPVARVRYAFGGGGGTNSGSNRGDSEPAEDDSPQATVGGGFWSLRGLEGSSSAVL